MKTILDNIGNKHDNERFKRALALNKKLDRIYR